MGTERDLIKPARRVDLLVVDRALAVLMTAGVLADAASQLHRGLDALEVASLVVLTGSVAWRRRAPVLTTLAAITGFAAFVAASGYVGDGAFEVAAIGLNFYLVGRRSRGRRRVLPAAGVLAYWLAGVAVITYSTPGGSVSQVLGPWMLVGGLPLAVGRLLEARAARTRTLAESTTILDHEQDARARRAAGEERTRMARELHDVIAHNVSVMVVQTSAARRVAAIDLDAARAALEAVEHAGREALVELRRIVGVLRRDHHELAGSVAPGLAQLDALLDRARGAGLAVKLRIEGRPGSVSPGVDLVGYRVLQEALTNVIKHAGPTRAQVTVRYRARELELEVLNTGRGSGPAGRHRRRSGHGLIGMSERVALYGGELHAGRRTDIAGFEVRARIPLDASRSQPPTVNSRPGAGGEPPLAPAAPPHPWRWLDPALAAALLLALEVSVITADHRRGPLTLNLLLAAAIALAALWRRRWPLLFVLAVGALATLSRFALTPVTGLAAGGAFLVLVPAYTVAAWEERRTAVLGLAFALCGALLLSNRTLGTLAGAAFAMSAAWGAGRAFRAQRVRTAALSRTSARLNAEREDRERLAVAGERTRIASELHAVVARSVAAMVVQAGAARGMLGAEPANADTAMSAVEHTGRQALSEMRRILGVLRHAQDEAPLEPRPGVQQIYTLIQRAREAGQPVELSVDGEPGTLSAAVDLGIYRILEEALASARRQPKGLVGVVLRFGDDDLELQLTAQCDGPSAWPTDAMRERAALCGGALHRDDHSDTGWQLTARLPRELQGALA